MADMTASLVKDLLADSSKSQVARISHSRQTQDPKGPVDTDAGMPEGRQIVPTGDNSLQNAAESGKVYPGVPMNRMEAAPDGTPRSESFRKVLKSRLRTALGQLNAGDAAADNTARRRSESSPWLITLPVCLAENPLEMLAAKAASAPQGRRDTQSQRKATPPLQILQTKTTGNTRPKEMKATREQISSERLSGAETSGTREQKVLAERMSRSVASIEKSPEPHKNAKAGVADAENASGTMQFKIPNNQSVIAMHAAGEDRISAFQMRDSVAGGKSGGHTDSVKMGKMAAGDGPSQSLPAGHGLNARDEAAVQDATRQEGGLAEAVARKKDASANVSETSAELVQPLKPLQDTNKAVPAEKPQAIPAPAAQAAKPNALVAPAESPAEQIIQNIRLNARGSQQAIDIQLHPTELGMVRMSFQNIDGEVRGTLFVDKAQTRYEIEKELPQIVASLQQHGIQTRRFDVVMNQEPGQQNAGQNAHADARFAEAEYGGFRDYRDGGASADGGMGQSEHVDRTEAAPRPETRVSDEAINVYI